MNEPRATVPGRNPLDRQTAQRGHMEFSIGGDTPLLDPSSDDIEAGLSSLTGEGDSFAILAESPMTYIQTSGSATSGFVLEYQTDSLDQHFRSTSHQLPLHQVIEAFQRYRACDPAWREVTTWEREDLSAEVVGGAAFLADGLALARRKGRQEGVEIGIMVVLPVVLLGHAVQKADLFAAFGLLWRAERDMQR